jgi:hypothetical protein
MYSGHGKVHFSIELIDRECSETSRKHKTFISNFWKYSRQVPGPDVKFFKVNSQKFDMKVSRFLDVSEHSLSISSIEKRTFFWSHYMGPGSAGPDTKFFQVNFQKFDIKVLCFLDVSEHSLSISSIEK